jgi:predicted nucleotidyltransferase component of viral defense system
VKIRSTDLGAAAQAKLLQRSRERGEDNQLLLLRYANERLLYRLAQAPHAEAFVLKGAALFTIWTGEPHRATRDIDLLGYGDPSAARIRDVFRQVILSEVQDGVTYDATTLDVAPIRGGQEYGGIRVGVVANVGTARVKLLVDIGFGDAITPDALTARYPTLLDDPAPVLRAYPRETVVAEKLEAMVNHWLGKTVG